MNASVAVSDPEERASAHDYVTVKIAGQWFAVPVARVRDLVDATVIYRAPLAAPEIAGSINLRGSVVTVIDMCVRLGAQKPPARAGSCLIVERANDPSCEVCALLIDEAGEVAPLSRTLYEPCPSTLDPQWRDCAPGLFRTKGALILLLDVDAVLRWDPIRCQPT
jgi:purine-binding chemotaxis protein CheW